DRPAGIGEDHAVGRPQPEYALGSQWRKVEVEYLGVDQQAVDGWHRQRAHGIAQQIPGLDRSWTELEQPAAAAGDGVVTDDLLVGQHGQEIAEVGDGPFVTIDNTGPGDGQLGGDAVFGLQPGERQQLAIGDPDGEGNLLAPARAGRVEAALVL